MLESCSQRSKKLGSVEKVAVESEELESGQELPGEPCEKEPENQEAGEPQKVHRPPEASRSDELLREESPAQLLIEQLGSQGRQPLLQLLFKEGLVLLIRENEFGPADRAVLTRFINR